MFAKTVTLSHWRNLQDATVNLSPNVNLFFGKNAQGKTNFLESLYLFSQGKSFRTSQLKDFCAFGAEEASAELIYTTGNQDNRLKAQIYSDNRRRVFTVDTFPVKKQSEFQGHFYTVLFTPQHLDLVKGGPSERRKFLDLAISPLKPRYASLLEEYDKIIEQKNALLKDMFRYPELKGQLDVWNEKQAAVGAYITFMRASYVEKLKAPAAQMHDEISMGKESLSLEYLGFGKDKDVYLSRLSCQEALLDCIEDHREEEIRAGMTLVGPQRDDMEILLDNKPLRSFGSQGQQRSAVISVKLGEGQLVYDTVKEQPVYLFDDINSELDASRRSFLLHKLQGRQVIITACDRARYRTCEELTAFQVKDGKIEVSKGHNG